MNFKIGFACMRWPQTDEFKIGGSTLTHLRSLPKNSAIKKLEEKAEENAKHIYNLVSSVAKEPEHFRMLRIGSSVWPAFDTEFGPYDTSRSIIWLNKTRDLAKEKDIRLSMHPDQFHALASDKQDVVDRTIISLNIFGDIAENLGVTEVNIHCWGRQGVSAFKSNMQYLNANIAERLTVENDEFTVGVEELVDIGVPIVFDPHHHFIKTGDWGSEELFQLAANTWNRKPKIHYSYPKNCAKTEGWPVLSGSRTQARAHSDTYNNVTVSEWILDICGRHSIDIMCEAKHKDIARDKLYSIYLQSLGGI